MQFVKLDDDQDDLDGPITKRKLGSEVAHRIRQAILTGQLKPGMRVVQEEWAQRLGVSRMPIRDAMKMLASEGLVTVSDNQGTTVASLSEEDMSDAYLLNGILTGIAAERAAQRITDEEIAELERIQEKMTAAIEADDIDTAQQYNWAFHRVINKSSKSPRLIRFLRVASAGVPHFAIREIPEWRVNAASSHEPILQALKDGDGERARTLMQEHILTVNRLVVKHLSQQGFFGG